MNPLNRQWFYRGFRRRLVTALGRAQADTIWDDAGNLFWTGYVEMTMVSLSDFLILDCWLPPKAKPFIKGAERCKAWDRWEWLKTLAIPEHGLLWTLIVCPIAGLAVAGLNLLF